MQQKSKPSRFQRLDRSKLIIISIVAVFVLVIAAATLAVLLMRPPTTPPPSSHATPKGVDAYTVGDQPYVYACSVFDRSLVLKTFGIPDQKSEEYTHSEQAIPKEAAHKDQADLLKAERGILSVPRVESECRFRTFAAESTRLILIVAQYENDQAAKAEFDHKKEVANVGGGGVTALPAIGESGYIRIPRSGVGADITSAFLLHKNKIVEFEYKQTLVAGSENVAKIEAILGDIKQKLDSKAAITPPNYVSGVEFDGKAAVDACQQANFANAAGALGGVTYYPVSAEGFYDFTAKPNTIGGMRRGAESTCALRFRYAVENSAFEALPEAKRTKLPETKQYPHKITIGINVHQTSGDAKTAIDNIAASAKEDGATVEQLSFGDAAIQYKQSGEKLGETERQDIFYVAYKNYRISITIQQIVSSSPFRSAPQTIDSKMLEQITNGIKVSLDEKV